MVRVGGKVRNTGRNGQIPNAKRISQAGLPSVRAGFGDLNQDLRAVLECNSLVKHDHVVFYCSVVDHRIVLKLIRAGCGGKRSRGAAS